MTNDIQQLVPGFNTVDVLGGPMVVRVHEALDSAYANTAHRYFISVDLKFREFEALNIGKPGCLGCTKAEATREAKSLQSRIITAVSALRAAEELALNYDTSTNRYTAKRQADALNKIVGRYNAEFVS